MDQILESLGRIAELSAEELKSLEDSVIAEFGTLETQDHSQEVVDGMLALANAAKTIKSENERREVEAEQLSLQANEAIAQMQSIQNGETAEADAETETPAEEDSEEKLEDAAEEATDPDEDEDEKKKEFSSESTETVAEALPEAEASVADVAEATPAEEPATTFSIEEPSVAELATEEIEETSNTPEAEEASDKNESTEEPVTASTTPEFEAPEDLRPNASTPSVQIHAGSDLPGITAGATLPNLRAVAEGILARKRGMGRTTGGDGEQSLVASIKTNFDEANYLDLNDIDGNTAKLETATAIVAAGGLYAPLSMSYDIFTLGESEARPVRDSLPRFGADRGGIRFMESPSLADYADTAAPHIWTLEDDEEAEDSELVKPSIRIKAGQIVEEYIYAVPLTMTFGNMGARTYPELVERHIKLAMVQHARLAENELLARMAARSTAVTTGAELGAARDIFNAIELAASGYRSRHRLDPNYNLRVMFPEWFKNALRADLIKQLPGDGRDGTFNLAEAEINKWFATRNVNVTWFLDGQIFGAQKAGALNKFPAKLNWFLFSEGTFIYLDGGSLDLGIVRDSTLNAKNDYKMFVENFEGVAKLGIEALFVTSDLELTGSSSGTTDVTYTGATDITFRTEAKRTGSDDASGTTD